MVAGVMGTSSVRTSRIATFLTLLLYVPILSTRWASGRSAPDWIDSFVILEAKNLLRYSDESIKEIAYKLNFPSASVFNKFFKANTGLVPSDYRRGE